MDCTTLHRIVKSAAIHYIARDQEELRTHNLLDRRVFPQNQGIVQIRLLSTSIQSLATERDETEKDERRFV